MLQPEVAAAGGMEGSVDITSESAWRTLQLVVPFQALADSRSTDAVQNADVQGGTSMQAWPMAVFASDGPAYTSASGRAAHTLFMSAAASMHMHAASDHMQDGPMGQPSAAAWKNGADTSSGSNSILARHGVCGHVLRRLALAWQQAVGEVVSCIQNASQPPPAATHGSVPGTPLAGAVHA